MTAPLPGERATLLRRLRQPLGGKALIALALLVDYWKDLTRRRLLR